MSSGKRKRFNPLEETPSASLAPSEEHAVAALGRTGDAGQAPQAPVERIERLPPSRMLPDRFQPRRLLPASIRRRFFAGEVDCYHAAREWLKRAERDASDRRLVDELLAMGESFEEHGQIKPITGSWARGAEGEFRFLIETGERRYWAACLRAARDKSPAEPLLRVEAVARPTRQRQVLENRHAEPPSAVGQACEVAALILDDARVAPEGGSGDEWDYFRQALARRAPRGLWARLEPIMQLSTRRMQQLLAVLQMPSELLEQADRHRLPERVLREILALPPKQWNGALQAAIAHGLTAAEMTRLDERSAPATPADELSAGAIRRPERIAYGGIRRFARAAARVELSELPSLLDDVADEVVSQGFDEFVAPLLSQLATLIEARRSRL